MNRFLLLLTPLCLLSSNILGQNNCSSAVFICANNEVQYNTAGSGSNTGGITDPSICGSDGVQNSLFFTVEAICNGTATISVNTFTGGLEMAAYTGTCGSLVAVSDPTGCNSDTTSFSITFNVTNGTIYYIMVDGITGNVPPQFKINASGCIKGKPQPGLTINPFNGLCAGDSVHLTNVTVENGGPVTYKWKIDDDINPPQIIPSSGTDTSLYFSKTQIGNYTISLTAQNSCAVTTIAQTVDVQDLKLAVSFTPSVSCLGTNIHFTGSAQVLPNPPVTPSNIVKWEWDFGDPSSGINNTYTSLTEDTANHIFVGTGPCFTVTLIAHGTCGPDTINTNVCLLPEPKVNAGIDTNICEGSSITLTANLTNAFLPVIYTWTGSGTISCAGPDTACSSTSISGLTPAGSPHAIVVSIQDANGCSAPTDTVLISVNPKPVVSAGLDTTVCSWNPTVICATPIAGTSPFSCLWYPSSGLNDSSLACPTATVGSNKSFCVKITDSLGCESDSDCVSIITYPHPTLSSNPSSICINSAAPRLATLTVTSTHADSSLYNWITIPPTVVPVTAPTDSSAESFDFTACSPGSYCFRVQVTDNITGCIDTISACFVVDSIVTVTITTTPSSPSVCEGGCITLSASGANTYSWAPGAETSASINVCPGVSTTYTVTGIKNSCIGTAPISVTVNPIPTAVASVNPNDICGCEGVNLSGLGSTLGMNYQWSSANGSIINSPTSLNTPATSCSTDVFRLIVKEPITGCADTANTTIISYPKPKSIAIVSPTKFCKGIPTLVTLDGTGSSTGANIIYQWTSSVTIDSANSLITTATISTATTFTLTVTHTLTGCDSSYKLTVTPYPTPVLSPKPNSFCIFDPIPWIDTIGVVGAALGSTFQWTIPGGVINTTAPDTNRFEVFDFSGLPLGDYCFQVVVTDGITGCIDTITNCVYLTPDVNLTPMKDTVICLYDTLCLKSSGGVNYSWYFASSTTVIGTEDSLCSPPVSLPPGTWNIVVVGTSGICSDTDTVAVTVLPVPTSPISGDSSFCEYELGKQYCVNQTPGSTYNWTIVGTSGTIVSGQGTNCITVDWSTAEIDTIIVIETNIYGCLSSYDPQKLTITINPIPSTQPISGPDSVCDGSNVNYCTIASAGSTYNWAITGGGTILSGQGTNCISVNWNSTGGVISVVETVTASGCSDTAKTLSVNVNPRPTAHAGNDTTICAGSCITIGGNPSATGGTSGYYYSWTPTLFLNSDTVANPTFCPPVTITENLIVADINGCSDTDNVVITVNELPVAYAGINDSICSGETIHLTGATSSPSNASILWTTSGDGTFTDNTITNATYIPGTGDITNGTVTLTLKVSSPPCGDSISSITYDINTLPVATIATTPNDTICRGTNVIITASPSSGVSYIWNTTPVQTTASINVSPINNYTYTVIVNTTSGCSDTASKRIVVVQPPNAGNDTTVCFGDTIPLHGTVSSFASGGTWSTFNGSGSFLPDASNLNASYAPGSTDSAGHTVNMVLTTNTLYCSDFNDTMKITSFPSMSVEAGPDQVVAEGSVIKLNPLLTNSPCVIWTTNGTGTFSPNASAANASYTPSPEDYYNLSLTFTITTCEGCDILSDSLLVYISDVVIPNIITPGENSSKGVNDVFYIKRLPSGSKLLIYDRWGTKVYNTNDYKNDWDGKGASDGVYYYELTLPPTAKTSNFNRYGFLHVIR